MEPKDACRCRIAPQNGYRTALQNGDEAGDGCSASATFSRLKRGEPSRFEFIRFDASSLTALAGLQEQFQRTEKLIDGIGPGRSTSLALTKLEESYMWVGKAIRDAQRQRPGG